MMETADQAEEAERLKEVGEARLVMQEKESGPYVQAETLVCRVSLANHRGGARTLGAEFASNRYY